MKYRALLLPVLLSLGATQAVHAEESKATIIPYGSTPAIVGPADWFTGRTNVQPMFGANQIINAGGAEVTFMPGSRSAWHTHPAGQYMIITNGKGLTQEWGGPIREIEAGDAVWCPPGVKHWHGASPDSAMTHIVFTGVDKNGKNVEWMEHVSDEQYLDK